MKSGQDFYKKLHLATLAVVLWFWYSVVTNLPKRRLAFALNPALIGGV